MSTSESSRHRPGCTGVAEGTKIGFWKKPFWSEMTWNVQIRVNKRGNFFCPDKTPVFGILFCQGSSQPPVLLKKRRITWISWWSTLHHPTIMKNLTDHTIRLKLELQTQFLYVLDFRPPCFHGTITSQESQHKSNEPGWRRHRDLLLQVLIRHFCIQE